MAQLLDLIPEDACQEAKDWVLGLPAGTSPEEAWRLCQRPDWMFWLLGRAAEPNKPGIAAAACEIARTVLHLVRPSQPNWLRVEGPTDTMDLIPDAEIHEACAAAGVVWAGEAIDETTYRVEVRS